MIQIARLGKVARRFMKIGELPDRSIDEGSSAEAAVGRRRVDVVQSPHARSDEGTISPEILDHEPVAARDRGIDRLGMATPQPARHGFGITAKHPSREAHDRDERAELVLRRYLRRSTESAPWVPT